MSESISNIKHLISESSLAEAADLLSSEWQGKDTALYNLTLQLKERHHALKKEIALGVISHSDAELERARITDALLFLCDKLENPAFEMPRHLRNYYQTEDKKPSSRKWLLPIVGSVLLLIIGYFSIQSAIKPSDFDLKIFLHGPNGLADPISNTQVKLALGNYQLPPREVDAQGRVDFTDIPIKYAKDSVHLVLLDLPYEVVQQSASTPAESDNGSITFELKPTVQWTNWRGTIKDSTGKPLANAKLDIESGLAEVTTNENGNFTVKVPKAAGERVQVVVYLAGKQVLNSSFVLTEQIPTQIQLKEPQ